MTQSHTNSHKKHINILVIGKVQGVYYRLSTQKKAIEIGITGSVKNQHDGSVYIEAEGSDDQLQKFINWCQIGPEMAHVEHIIVNDNELKGFSSFEIAY